jgi:hypothetical protein
VRLLHRLKPVPPLLLMMGGATLCGAENSCPWLNSATAAGVLGGPVTASVSPAVCEFVHDQTTLHIEVRVKPASIAAKCESPATPLRAIGNEAVACSVSGREMVIGRVRDQRFVVWIQSTDPAVRTRARSVAEQVAGSLF